MSRRIVDLDGPDRIVVGSATREDDEEVYLQAARGAHSITVVLERQQVALLGQRLLEVLGELERRGLLAIEARTTARAGPDRLLEPLNAEFRVGTLTIGWDNDASRVVVEAYAMVFDAGAGESALLPDAEPDEDVPDDDPLGPDLLRVRLAPGMALRFARQAMLAGA